MQKQPHILLIHLLNMYSLLLHQVSILLIILTQKFAPKFYIKEKIKKYLKFKKLQENYTFIAHNSIFIMYGVPTNSLQKHSEIS